MANIVYRPGDLPFEQFQAVDTECFPDEPVDAAALASFLKQDFWAAYDGGRLVGYCSMHRKAVLAWLRRIGVAARHRRQGIGRGLINAALERWQELGLPQIILYVQDGNLPAMSLYEQSLFLREEATFQYVLRPRGLGSTAAGQESEPVKVVGIDEVPESKLPRFPEQWADIRSLHRPPEQYVLIFRDGDGQELGYCRLTPGFPGCFPFVLQDPDRRLKSALLGLRRYLLPDKEILKLTFADERVAAACRSLGIELNYSLFKMVRRRETEADAPGDDSNEDEA